MLGVLIISGFSVTWVIRRFVTMPLDGLGSHLGDIANGNGDLTRRIPVTLRGGRASDDEVTAVAVTFNRFLDNLQQLIRKVGETTLIVFRRLTLSECTKTLHHGIVFVRFDPLGERFSGPYVTSCSRSSVSRQPAPLRRISSNRLRPSHASDTLRPAASASVGRMSRNSTGC